MSERKDFEDYCKRTRPVLPTVRWRKSEYIDERTQAAWNAWKYLDKQYNPRPKGFTAGPVKP